MGFINITAGKLRFLSPSGSDNDFAAVWDTEQLFISRVDKADALLSSADMPVKPFLHIAVTVKVVIVPCGIASEQESVFLRIGSETVLCAIVPLKSTYGITPCKSPHIIAVVQKPFVLPQFIDNRVKLRLKFVRFPLRPVVKPCGVKTISRVGKITT